MAAKRIVKFIIKMIVTAGIVVGAYFGISALVNKPNTNNIINASTNVSLVTKLQESHTDVVSDNVNLQPKIDVLDKINIAMLDYYDYYISLTPFKKYNSDISEGAIINKIDELSKQVELTTRYNTSINSSTNNALKQEKVLLTAKEYAKQTKLLFELNDLLKRYIYQGCYNLTSTGIVYEAQLEMIKDYSRAVFNFAIEDKINYNIPENILKEGNIEHTSASFIDVMYKFNDRQTLAVNGNVEVSFVQYYDKMDKTELNSFYLLNNTQKEEKVSHGIDDITKKMYFDSLLQYLKQEHI